VWARLAGVDTAALLDLALDHQVMFVPGSAFAVDAGWPEHARLSFATLPEGTLRAAAQDLMNVAGLTRG
jgi:2-aminoadipate transaminase